MARYIALAIVGLLFSLAAQILAPVLSLLTARGWPSWGGWFWTPDNDPYGDRSDWTSLPVGSYWRRVLWLWRNPAYGFDSTVLSVPLQHGDMLITNGHANNIGTPSNPAGSGIQTRTVLRDGKPLTWEWYGVFAYTSALCIRGRFGWKIPIGADGGIDPTRPATLVCSFNPFMGYSA
jgi:hypothetical protein